MVDLGNHYHDLQIEDDSLILWCHEHDTRKEIERPAKEFSMTFVCSQCRLGVRNVQVKEDSQWFEVFIDTKDDETRIYDDYSNMTRHAIVVGT